MYIRIYIYIYIYIFFFKYYYYIIIIIIIIIIIFGIPYKPLVHFLIHNISQFWFMLKDHRWAVKSQNEEELKSHQIKHYQSLSKKANKLRIELEEVSIYVNTSNKIQDYFTLQHLPFFAVI